MSRGLILLGCLSAAALGAVSPGLRASDPATPPPGYKTVYVQVGAKKMPILVKQQMDPLKNVNNPPDQHDPRRLYSETNYMANKSFLSGTGNTYNKQSDVKDHDAFVTKDYNSGQSSTPYNPGTKTAYQTRSFAGTSAATGYDKTFATSTADTGQDKTALAFAAMGSSDQNKTAAIDAKPVETYPAPMADKTFVSSEPTGVHHNVGETGDGQSMHDVQNLPNRPLTIDEVRNLINHGFEPNLAQAPPAGSKPLNDPDYRPEPLRIEPTESETVPHHNAKDDDDKDDPVPSPGTMAEPLPQK